MIQKASGGFPPFRDSLAASGGTIMPSMYTKYYPAIDLSTILRSNRTLRQQKGHVSPGRQPDLHLPRPEALVMGVAIGMTINSFPKKYWF
jgi:hypothetical protein